MPAIVSRSRLVVTSDAKLLFSFGLEGPSCRRRIPTREPKPRAALDRIAYESEPASTFWRPKLSSVWGRTRSATADKSSSRPRVDYFCACGYATPLCAGIEHPWIFLARSRISFGPPDHLLILTTRMMVAPRSPSCCPVAGSEPPSAWALSCWHHLYPDVLASMSFCPSPTAS